MNNKDYFTLQRRTVLKLLCALGLSSTGVPVLAAPGTFPVGHSYRLPEESELHERTFMQWPVNRIVHPDPVFLRLLQQSIADIANTISEFETVVMLMGKEHVKGARQRLSDNVDIWSVPTDDLWCRDAGPVFVRNENYQLAVCQFNFNGWGNKQVHENDQYIAERVAKILDLPIYDSGVTGEAGGVESDGHGTLLAHESSWLIDNRNPESRAVLEQRLLDALGASKMIWAPGVRDKDITDYHIDSLARFVGAGKVLIQLPEELSNDDPWSAAAFETLKILHSETAANGDAIQVIELPEPIDVRVSAADFVASYVNYYLCNDGVIAAQFGDPEADERAVDTLQSLYPDREIVTLNVDPLGETGGGIHCATQQQPAV